MRILVCVKQVPASMSGVTVEAGRVKVNAAGPRPFAMNRFDEFAVEEALRIKESLPGTNVDVISVGTEEVEWGVRRAMGMGADRGIVVRTEKGALLEPSEVAVMIAAAAAGREYDMVLAGAMSEDGANCATGPMAAEFLGLPCASFVVKLEVDFEGGEACVEREVSGGTRECIKMKLPALVTVQAGINRPRYPSLSNVLRAEKAELEIIPAGELWMSSPRAARVLGAAYPEKSRESVRLDGTTREKAKLLHEILKAQHLV